MTHLHIPDMSCGHCKAAVTEAIKAIDPSAQIEFDMEARKIALRSAAADEAIQAALVTAGYPSTPV